MQFVHNLLMGASVVLLDPFAGDPFAPVTITVPSDDAVANDFARVAGDLTRAIDKIEHAGQIYSACA
jgi:hypothetical protein